MAVYTGGRQLEWRETGSGQLPSPRRGLRAATVDNIIFVSGGWGPTTSGGDDSFRDILSWDPTTESWQEAGMLAVARSFHAAVAVPASIIESECSAMLSI